MVLCRIYIYFIFLWLFSLQCSEAFPIGRKILYYITYFAILHACLLSCFSRAHLFTTLWTCSPPGFSAHRTDSPGNNTGVGSHAFLQGIFQSQGSNLCHQRLLCLLRFQADSLLLEPPGKTLYLYLN